jgi:hypothetical protein
MEQDLFNTPELLPQEVRDILAKYDEMGTSYDTCNNLIKELEQVGYTCEYGLDGIPYELQTIEINKTMKKEFEFTLDEKMTIWNRKQFTIEADTIEEAKQKAIELVKNGEEIDFYSSEYLHETEELMELNKNDGHATIVLMHNQGRNTNNIYENK